MSKSASRARLTEIIRKRSFGRGEITLASGRKSDFYFNLKPTMLDPEGAALLAELTYEALKDDNLDFVGGLEMGAVPLAGAIAQLSWIRTPDRGVLRAQEAEGMVRAWPWRVWPRARPAGQAHRHRRGRHHDRRVGNEGRRGRERGRGEIVLVLPWSIGRRRNRSVRGSRARVSLAVQGQRVPKE